MLNGHMVVEIDPTMNRVSLSQGAEGDVIAKSLRTGVAADPDKPKSFYQGKIFLVHLPGQKDSYEAVVYPSGYVLGGDQYVLPDGSFWEYLHEVSSHGETERWTDVAEDYKQHRRKNPLLLRKVCTDLLKMH